MVLPRFRYRGCVSKEKKKKKETIITRRRIDLQQHAGIRLIERFWHLFKRRTKTFYGKFSRQFSLLSKSSKALESPDGNERASRPLISAFLVVHPRYRADATREFPAIESRYAISGMQMQ